MKSKEVVSKLENILNDIDGTVNEIDVLKEKYTTMRAEVDELIKKVSKSKKKLSNEGNNKVVDELIVNDVKYYIDSDSNVYSDEGLVIGKKKKNKIILN